MTVIARNLTVVAVSIHRRLRYFPSATVSERTRNWIDQTPSSTIKQPPDPRPHVSSLALILLFLVRAELHSDSNHVNAVLGKMILIYVECQTHVLCVNLFLVRVNACVSDLKLLFFKYGLWLSIKLNNTKENNSDW